MPIPKGVGVFREGIDMPKRLSISYACTGEELAERARRERNPRVRIRLLLIRQVMEGEAATVSGLRLGIGRSQACVWVRRFNEAGVEGLMDKPRAPRRSRLAPELEEEFRGRVLQGPRPEEGRSAFRGRDIMRILQGEFRAPCSLSGAYYILHRLGFECLSPRPVHPGADPKEQEDFKKTPCVSRTSQCRAS